MKDCSDVTGGMYERFSVKRYMRHSDELSMVLFNGRLCYQIQYVRVYRVRTRKRIDSVLAQEVFNFKYLGADK